VTDDADAPYIDMAARRAVMWGHTPLTPTGPGPASFWHVCRNPDCGDLAWADHNPDLVPCWNCGTPAPQATLNDLMRGVRQRDSEHCPTFNGEHTTGTLY
jgi:hypothetical protein